MRLCLEGVCAAYDGAPVLDCLSFEVPAGAIGCLLGASGSGKTTALRIIAGLEPVNAGRVVVGGRVLTDGTGRVAPEHRGIGMVFQDFALLPHLNVLDNVRFGLHRMPATGRMSRARDMLAAVGLAALAERYPHQLSGGQQQRVALARALAPRPALLLLDEPFASLDLELRESLGQALRALLLAEGTTALLVTHSQHEAFALADLVGVLDQGRLRQWDTAYNLYHRPADRMVADFVGEGAFLRGERRADGTIVTELGTFPASSPGAPGPVEVLLRPDDLVHDDTSPLRGRVRHKVFRGGEMLYTLTLASGAEVLALVPSHHDHGIGTELGVRPDLAHVIAFAAPPGPPASP
jgi:iron(III) transport system ATP-binding protein